MMNCILHAIFIECTQPHQLLHSALCAYEWLPILNVGMNDPWADQVNGAEQLNEQDMNKIANTRLKNKKYNEICWLFSWSVTFK